MNLMEDDWDYLIVLDACRYDYFKALYRDFFEGKLEKIISPASYTLGWCRRTFKGTYNDTVYISANPLVNSKLEIRGFKAPSHFYRVVDVWDWGWDKSLGTVHPKQVNRAVLKNVVKYSDKRLIIHYIQPHTPYLTIDPELQTVFSEYTDKVGLFLRGRDLSRKGSIIRRSLMVIFRSWASYSGPFLDSKFGFLFRRLENLWKPRTIQKELASTFGLKKLHEAYLQNLKIVLRYTQQLLQFLRGKIVVTADHGELLGENNSFHHFPARKDKKLLEVPYFTIEERK